MNKIESCVFIDLETATERPVPHFKANFFIFSIQKEGCNFSFELGVSSKFRFKIADPKIKDYFIVTEGKCVGHSATEWHFSISADSVSSFQMRGHDSEWLFTDQRRQILLFGNHPWYISYPISFVLKDFRNDVILMECSKGTNLVYQSGIAISLHIFVPNRAVSSLEIVLEDIYEVEDKTIFQARIKRIDKKLKEALSLQFLEGEPEASFTRLKLAGLPIPSFKGRLQFVPVSTEDDYSRVLSLRRKAYLEKKNSKVKPSAAAEDFADEFDRYSTIMALKLGSEVIATGRSVFNFGNSQQCEIIRLGFTPPDFIKDAKFVEISRFATHSEFRGKDLFLLLLSFAFRSAILTGHRYILADCEDHLLPTYRKWGAKVFDEKITHELENITLNVVYFDLHRTIGRARFYSKIPFIPGLYKKIAKDILWLSKDPFHDGNV